MPASRSAAVPRRSRPAPVSVSGVRWDRVGRMAMIAVGLVLLYLYAGAIRSLFVTRSAAATRRAQVVALERQNADLRRRRAALHSPATLEAAARQLGMVRPGERGYVIQGLPGG